ncbi:MAG: hypothetical protein AMS16_04010, partial [Planctomycetes bacterium DG_58]
RLRPDPFKSVPLKYGPYKGDTVVSTPRFLIIYEGMRTPGGGGSNVTISGKYDEVRPFFGGPGSGCDAGDKGIDFLHTYNGNSGTATLYLHGRLIRVEENGKLLRTQDGLYELGDEKLLVRVDREGHAHLLQGEEARLAEEALDDWFKTFEFSAFPPRLLKSRGAGEPDEKARQKR